jgi:hypothetical protein
MILKYTERTFNRKCNATTTLNAINGITIKIITIPDDIILTEHVEKRPCI